MTLDLEHHQYVLLAFWEVVIVFTLMVAAIDWAFPRIEGRIDRDLLRSLLDHSDAAGMVCLNEIAAREIRGLRPATVLLRTLDLRRRGLVILLPCESKHRVTLTPSGLEALHAT